MGTWTGMLPTSQQLLPLHTPVQSTAGLEPVCRGKEEAQHWAGRSWFMP